MNNNRGSITFVNPFKCFIFVYHLKGELFFTQVLNYTMRILLNMGVNTYTFFFNEKYAEAYMYLLNIFNSKRKLALGMG